MLKAQVLSLSLSLSLLVLVHTVPIKSQDLSWKSLENPRNRELFFRTLQAYLSERGIDMGKFSKSFRTDNRELTAGAAGQRDHLASAFSDYKAQEDAFAAFLEG